MRVRVDTDALRREAEAELSAAQELYRQKMSAADLLENRYRGESADEATAAPTPHILTNTNTSRQVSGRTPPKSTPPNIVDKLGQSIETLLSAASADGGATLADLAEAIMDRHKGVTRKQVARALYLLNKTGKIYMPRKQSGSVPGLYALPDQK